MEYTLLILLLPMLSFVGIGLLGRKLSHRAAGISGTLVLTAVTLLSYLTAFDYFTTQKVNGVWQAINPTTPRGSTWVKGYTSIGHPAGPDLRDDAGGHLHRIAHGAYLQPGLHERREGFQRYYSFLSLFTFSMMGLVLATNIFQMYIFWELVGCRRTC